jgi:cleavage stimulation factor subunit 3
VFRTDDLMQVFRNAVIPSTSSLRSRSPPQPVPPPRSKPVILNFKSEVDEVLFVMTGGRPPPDYGPYQGPGGVRRR